MGSLSEDLSPIRIVRFFKDYIDIDDEGVGRMTQQLGSSFSNGVVILSVVGPRESGKSFLLNLLLKYLRAKGKGNWLNDLTKKKEPLRGFATKDWNSSNSTDLGGVYLWPESLTVQTSKDEQTQTDAREVPVILLDTIFEHDTTDEERRELMDVFLCMISSKVIINSFKTFEVGDLLPLTLAHAKIQPFQNNRCNQVAFLVRDSQITSHGSKAMTRMEGLIKAASDIGSDADHTEFIKNLDVKESCFMKQPDTVPICDKDGLIVKMDAAFDRSLKGFMSTLLNPDSLCRGTIIICDFKRFLCEFAKYASEVYLELKVQKTIRARAISNNVVSTTVINEVQAVVEETSTTEYKHKQTPIQNQTIKCNEPEDLMVRDDNSSPIGRTFKAVTPNKSRDRESTVSRHFNRDTQQENQIVGSSCTDGITRETTIYGFAEPLEELRSPQALKQCRITESETYLKTKSSPNHGSIERVFPLNPDKLNFETEQEKKKVTNQSVDLSSSLAVKHSQSSLEQRESAPKTENTGPSKGSNGWVSNCKDLELEKQKQLKLKLLDISGIQNGKRHNLKNNTLSAEDKMRLDNELQKEVERLKNEFISELSTINYHSKEYIDQLIIYKLNNLRSFLEKGFSSTQIESSIQQLKTSLQVAEKSHFKKMNKKNRAESVPTPLQPEDDQMDCTPPPPKPQDNSDVNGSNGTLPQSIPSPEPMDIDQTCETHEKIQSCLKKHYEQLEDFTKKINIYKCSTPLLESKMQELSAGYFHEIEQIQRQQGTGGPDSETCHFNAFSLIEQVNAEFKRKIELAVNDYDNCLQSLKRKLKEVTRNMARTIVSGETKSLYSGLGSSWYLEALKKHMDTVQQRPKEGIMQMLKSDTTNFFQAMTYLEEGLTLYRRHMIRQLEMYKCMSDELLSSCHMQAFNDAKIIFKSDSSFFASEFSNGIRVMHRAFVEVNQDIAKKENNTMLHIVTNYPKIKEFYHKMMKEFTSSTLWTPTQLQRIHKDVIQELCDAFKSACGFHPQSGMDVSTYIALLKTELNPLIVGYQQQNQRQSEKLLSSVDKAITENKRTYNHKMEEHLTKAGGWINPPDFEKHHRMVLEEVSNTLKFELKKMVGIVDHSSHVTSLKKKIEEDWADFRDGNEKKIKQMEEKEKDQQRNKKAEEAAEKLRIQDEERQQRLNTATGSKVATKPSTSTASSSPKLRDDKSQAGSVTAASHTSAQASNCVETSSRKPLQRLQPIAVEFGLHFIRVGWINPDSKKFELIKNEWGEEATPSVVGFSYGGQVLVGSEVINHPPNEIKTTLSMDYILFQNEKPETVFKYDIRGIQDARKELLMGHMLSQVKEGVEKQLNGRWETVVLTVPLWYTSVHRQAARDAANIAGFKNIHLINETSAAAVNFLNFTAKQDGTEKIIVGVTSEFYFDAAIYSIEDSQLRMEASCGNLHAPTLSPSYRKLISDTIKSFCKMFTTSSSKTQMEKSISELIGNNIIRTCACVHTNSATSSFSKELGPLLVRKCRDKSSNFSKRDDITIIEGAAYVASLLQNKNHSPGTEMNQLQMPKIVQDRLTYNLEVMYLEYEYSRNATPAKFFEYKASLMSRKGVCLTQDMTLRRPNSSETHYFIYEGSTKFGSLRFLNPTTLKDVQLKGTVSNEGIIRIEVVAESIDESLPVDFKFHSPNLPEEQVQKMTDYMESLQCGFAEKKRMDEARQALHQVLNELKPKLQGLAGVKQMILNKSVKDAEAIVDHNKSTLSMMEIKIKELVVLRSKYSL